MICTANDGSLGRRLRDAARERDLPLSGSLELTRRCNLRCRHCYAGPGIGCEHELADDEWGRLIDESAAAGVLRLTLTGGEPLLHPAFAALYERAVRLGVRVIVFTNGTLLDAAVLRLFERYPPLRVELSVPAVSSAVSERVTGLAAAAAASWDAARALLDAGVTLVLKTTVMRSNRDEADAIQARARALGVPWRMATDIVPAIDGSCAPLAERLPVDEAVAIEFSDPERAESVRQSVAARKPDGRQFACGAGRTSFFVAADGGLQACVAIRFGRQSVIGRPLVDVWREVRDRVRAAQFPLAHDGSSSHNTDWTRGVLCPGALFTEQGQVQPESWEMEWGVACARLNRLGSESA